jgi:hypothetical protein
VEATTTESEFSPVKNLFGNSLRFLVDQFMAVSRLAFLEGKNEALRDLAQNRLAIRTYGRPARWRHIYAEMLHDQYQVDLRVVAGEEVSSRQREETHGYNSIMKPAIRKKYGRDFLDIVVDRAKEKQLKSEKPQPIVLRDLSQT